MSPFMEKNPTQFFAVVGAAYVPEHHLDTYSRCERSPSKKFTFQEVHLATRRCR